jgi:hypothetical protein
VETPSKAEVEAECYVAALEAAHNWYENYKYLIANKDITAEEAVVKAFVAGYKLVNEK